MNVPRAFRAHILRHNRRVLGIAAMSLSLSLALWGALYFLLYWAALFLVTLIRGVDAEAPTGLLPKFALAALTLCGVEWIWKWFRPFPRMVDRKTPVEFLFEALLALPKMTVSALQTLTAYRKLTEEEMLAAWHLLAKIVRQEKLTIQELPLEIPQVATRRKVLMALQLTGLVELKAGEDGLGFRVADERAKRLGQLHVRIRTRG